jgi:hypothetical protein
LITDCKVRCYQPWAWVPTHNRNTLKTCPSALILPHLARYVFTSKDSRQRGQVFLSS